MDENRLKDTVKEKYGKAALQAAGGAASCCGPSACGGKDPISADLYEAAQISGIPEQAALASLGCGNPTALAGLEPGEIVLDLGSGGGIDVLLSAKRVGSTGKAYGLDMTDEMLALARANQKKAGVENVEFLKGEIENIPLADNSVDVVISNCVINLAADKDKVLREAFRVLRPGGRLAVSDIVFSGEVPEEIRKNVELWIGCVAGALEESQYRSKLAAAGFEAIELEPTRRYRAQDAAEYLSKAGLDAEEAAAWVDGKFFSAFIRARKPGQGQAAPSGPAPAKVASPESGPGAGAEEVAAAPGERKKLKSFERYLSIWVAACMLAGVLLGKLMPGFIDALRRLEFGQSSQINAPIAVLIWLMIIPMMMKVDFAAIHHVGKRPRGLLVTLFVNWLVKPFSMALFSWLFFRFVFSPWISPAEADQYIAGSIILAAAPCTAMVFVWSYLTDGDPAYTLVQVSVNDLIMLVAFAPIVRFLVSGASSLEVPFRVLLYSVIIFIVIPLATGVIVRRRLVSRRGKDWFEQQLLPRFAPVSMTALLATLVLIFGFQADNITGKFLHVLLIAVPILIQVYFNSSLAYGLMRLLRVPYSVAAPGALIGASNFFELAVATAIALFGPGSGAALATVVGVLIEVPVMLSVCAICNRTRHWFPSAAPAPPG